MIQTSQPHPDRVRPRLLAVHAHPDDESSKGAATMAKYAAEGTDVLVATCTGGERGSVLNPALRGDPELADRMPEVRAREMEEARRILGVRQEWLGFVDSGLPEGNPAPPLPPGCFARLDVADAASELLRVIREFRPHVVTTYAADGGYPHPDHVMTHRVTVAAFDTAADPDVCPEAGPPWQPLKLYYNHGSHPARRAALHRALLDRGLPSPYAPIWRDLRHQPPITTRVPCAAYFPVRDRALIAHASQIDPDGPWFAVPLALQQEIWPTEDYALARSLVDTHLPESDLFAGITLPGVPRLHYAARHTAPADRPHAGAVTPAVR
ncbi:mycothiol conjugate amidase Mca [Streptomyces sp. NPDC039016]|uniref:mycothiol conjugate amidase Mca n=1 Tax=Streptomyces sp. NPDC039016 TaxID=3154330 RepID=UPI00341171CD